MPVSLNQALKVSGRIAHASESRISLAWTGHSPGLIQGGRTCGPTGIVRYSSPRTAAVSLSVTRTSSVPDSSIR